MTNSNNLEDQLGPCVRHQKYSIPQTGQLEPCARHKKSSLPRRKMYLPKLGCIGVLIGPSIVKFWTTHTLSKERFFCHKIHEDECDRSEYNISRGENMKALQHRGCHNVSEIWVTAATLSSFLQYMLLSEDLMRIFSFGLISSVCCLSLLMQMVQQNAKNQM